MKLFFSILVVVFLASCESSPEPPDGDGDADTDSDADMDADTDVDTDVDVDGDVDADGDGDADVDADADVEADADGDETHDADLDSDFDLENPGVHMFLEMGNAFMIGAPIGFAAAGFKPTAREDFEPDDDPILGVPIDTCVPSDTLGSAGPGCTDDSDCAPEQQCLPTEHDDSGAPVAGSEDCVTPREMMDVGPFEMEGFEGGALTFTYTPEQSGAYMAPPGDGSIPPELIVFDRTYTFHGDGDRALGLGPFDGEVHLPPQVTLTSPPIVELPMGIPGIEVDPSLELVLEWDGAVAGGELKISMNGNPMGSGTPMTCRVVDDGEFTVPVEVVDAVGFGGLAFFNMLTFDRTIPGEATGEGLTSTDITALQSNVVNVARIVE